MGTPILGTLAPHFHGKMGTRALFTSYFKDPQVPIFTGNWGPSHENGDPQFWTYTLTGLISLAMISHLLQHYPCKLLGYG